MRSGPVQITYLGNAAWQITDGKIGRYGYEG